MNQMIYLALWDRKLQQRRIEYISMIGSYIFKKIINIFNNIFLNNNKNLCYFPDACTFHTSMKLEIHAIDCEKFNNSGCPVRTSSWASATIAERNFCVPFVIYDDLECILERMKKEENMKTLSYMYQHH